MKATIAEKIEAARLRSLQKANAARVRRIRKTVKLEKRITEIAATANSDLMREIQHTIIKKGRFKNKTYGEALLWLHWLNVSGEIDLTTTRLTSINALMEFVHGTGEAGKEKAKQAKDVTKHVLIVAQAEQKEVPFITGELTNGDTNDPSTAPESAAP